MKKVYIILHILFLIVLISLVSATDYIWCYQESANDSSVTSTNPTLANGDCGIYNGSYGFSINYFQQNNVIDGDWNTFGGGPVYNHTVNYTKPSGASSATWLVDDGVARTNFTIGSECFDSFSDKIYLKARTEVAAQVSFHCWNSTISDFSLVGTLFNQNLLYEEAIWWNISLGIDNCSAFDVTTLNISFFNETNLAPLNASFNVLFEYGLDYNDLTNNFSTSVENVHDYSFCINNPSNADVEFEYTNSLSDIRRYYLLNATLTNNIQSLELLLLDSTLSTLITLIVDDEDDNAISNAYIKTQRWYLDENKYRTVEISRTDYDGVAGQHLVMNTVSYRFIIEKDFQVLPPTPTAATPIYLTTLYFQLFTRGAYLETFSSYENIRYTFEYNNNTRNFTFFYSDVTGVSTTGCLQVKHSTMLRTLIDYDECTTANAATLSYAHPDETITYIGTAYIQPSNSPTTDTVLKILTGGGAKLYQIFGETGLFLSIILAVVLGGLGAMTGSAAIAIVFFLLGIIMPVIIGITYLSYTVLTSVVILLGLIMWRLRK